MDAYEEAIIQCKKESLKKREAQIVKATANGRVVGHQTLGNEKHIFYRNHLALLIKQDDHFYIEEFDVGKKGIFEDGVLIKDLTLDREVAQTERPRILFPESRRKSGEASRFSYDRSEVVKYADKWWNRENSDYPTFEVDCTNYVSQCLRAGGAAMDETGAKNKGWWCNDQTCSLSWSVAHSFRWYLASEGNHLHAVAVERPDQLVPGDVICYDWNGDDTWDHNTIVTDKDRDGMPLVNAHTYNSRHRYWAYEDSPAYTEHTNYKFFHINAD